MNLAALGLTVPLHRSQAQLAADLRRGLQRVGRDPDSPVVLVGHSQGGLAALRYAIDYPQQVLHAISVGVPWRGALSATRVTAALGDRGSRMVPGIRGMRRGSRFLTDLQSDLPQIADRVTNIYSSHELFIRPYTDAHIDLPGVRNLLVATQEEHLRHLQRNPELALDELIMDRSNHLREMNSAGVRAAIWRTVDEVALANGLFGDSFPPATAPPLPAASPTGSPASRR